MKPEVHIIAPKKVDVGIAFSSKERAAFTRESFPALLAEGDFDILWVDGSKTEEARALPFSYAASGRITEIHQNVGGGADAAILYALSLLLEKGYSKIGLLENDVKLLPGWHAKTFGLFARGAADGLQVGAVSARCHAERILVPRGDYALMFNLGAGMIVLTREAVEHILDYYRTATTGEVAFLFSHYTGLPFPVPWQVQDEKVAHIPAIRSTGDWMFEVSFLPAGLVALAPTPTLAHNLDDPHRHPLQETAAAAQAGFNWQGLCTKLQAVRTGMADDPVRGLMNHYDVVAKEWRAYPHHIAKALPDAFSGPWKTRWSKFMGPFGFETAAAGASLKLSVHGSRINLLLDGKKEPFSIIVNKQNVIEMKDPLEWQTASLGFAHSGPHAIELVFSRAGVMLALATFEGPQHWFKSAYNLRYKDLARFVEAD